MTLKDDIQLLRRVPLFEDLDDDKLRLVAFGAERRRVQEGQTLFREGARGDCAFIIASGSFDLARKTRKGSARLGQAQPGALLGEIAMISAVDRSMTAIAAEPSEVMQISRQLFHRMLEEYPDIAGLVLERVRGSFATLLADLERIAPKFSA